MSGSPEPDRHGRRAVARHKPEGASSILNGRTGISPEMAVRLSIAFDTSAESWLNQQLQYDLWRAEKSRKRLHVERLSAA